MRKDRYVLCNLSRDKRIKYSNPTLVGKTKDLAYLLFMENHTCFSSENFAIVKAYIAYRILNSSTGTHFYLEYPPSQEPSDGIKRPSKHPENVYNSYFDTDLNQIVFENKLFSHHFHAEKGLLTASEAGESIFCYLVDLAKN